MKINWAKYIFFVIVIILIGLAIYLLYTDKNKNTYAIENNKLEVNMIRELNIGVCKYDTINPILSKNRDIQYLDKLIFEPLLDITYDFKIENKLAKEFSKLNDTTYILKLREDVYWHDKEKFTSDDVIFTINNLKDNKIDSIYKENVKYIKEVEKIDEYTVKIVLNQKVDFFEYMMCIPILASHSYDKNLNSKTTLPIGTGNFKITKIEGNNIIIESSNLDSQSKITKINLVLKDSSNDLYTALEKNEIDLMITDNINYDDYIGTIGYKIIQYANREFDYIILNNENSILKDKEIRNAINYAIDTNKINYNVYENKYNVTSFPLDYGSYLYNYNINKENDINKAKSILSENGWTLSEENILKRDGQIFSIRLLVNKENNTRMKVANNIKEQLSEIGIIVNIIATNNYNFNNYLKNKNYDMILTGNIISNSPSLETFFGDDNLSNFKNEEVKSILNKIKSTDNQEEILKKDFKRLEEIYEEEIPFISLYFNSIFILCNKNLKGDFGGNWYNIYYNIEGWYKVDDS